MDSVPALQYKLQAETILHLSSNVQEQGVVQSSGKGWSELLEPKYRRIMLLTTLIPLFQQLSGVNTCILYSSQVIILFLPQYGSLIVTRWIGQLAFYSVSVQKLSAIVICIGIQWHQRECIRRYNYKIFLKIFQHWFWKCMTQDKRCCEDNLWSQSGENFSLMHKIFCSLYWGPCEADQDIEVSPLNVDYNPMFVI